MTKTPTESAMALEILSRMIVHHQDSAYFRTRGLIFEAARSDERFEVAAEKLKALLSAGVA